MQLVDPLSFNVLGNNGSFRTDVFSQLFNPTNTSPPFFQVFHPDFLKILGPSATIRAVAANPTFAFAHEAPIWVPHTDEVFFASNDGGALGMSDIDHNNQRLQAGAVPWELPARRVSVAQWRPARVRRDAECGDPHSGCRDILLTHAGL